MLVGRGIQYASGGGHTEYLNQAPRILIHVAPNSGATQIWTLEFGGSTFTQRTMPSGWPSGNLTAANWDGTCYWMGPVFSSPYYYYSRSTDGINWSAVTQIQNTEFWTPSAVINLGNGRKLLHMVSSDNPQVSWGYQLSTDDGVTFGSTQVVSSPALGRSRLIYNPPDDTLIALTFVAANSSQGIISKYNTKTFQLIEQYPVTPDGTLDMFARLNFLAKNLIIDLNSSNGDLDRISTKLDSGVSTSATGITGLGKYNYHNGIIETPEAWFIKGTTGGFTKYYSTDGISVTNYTADDYSAGYSVASATGCKFGDNEVVCLLSDSSTAKEIKVRTTWNGGTTWNTLTFPGGPYDKYAGPRAPVF